MMIRLAVILAEILQPAKDEELTTLHDRNRAAIRVIRERTQSAVLYIMDDLLYMPLGMIRF